MSIFKNLQEQGFRLRYDAVIGSCRDTELRIPPTTSDGGRVTAIGQDAFWGCRKLNPIYCESPSKPVGWDQDWNPDDCPVVWNYKP